MLQPDLHSDLSDWRRNVISLDLILDFAIGRLVFTKREKLVSLLYFENCVTTHPYPV